MESIAPAPPKVNAPAFVTESKTLRGKKKFLGDKFRRKVLNPHSRRRLSPRLEVEDYEKAFLQKA